MSNILKLDDPIVIVFLILIFGFIIATLFIVLKQIIQEKNRKRIASDFKSRDSSTLLVNQESFTEYTNNTNTKLNITQEPNVKYDKTVSRKVELVQEISNESLNNRLIPNIIQEFYMTKPVENYFPESAKSSTPDGTIYKFTITTNPKIATFQLHTLGAPIKEIIKRSETYILPGCNEDNVATLITKHIITIKPGTVCLENNKWIILNKAIIKYE